MSHGGHCSCAKLSRERRWGREMVAALNRVLKEDLAEKLIYKERVEEE